MDVEWEALVAALIGGGVVALLRISYERREKIRERQIEAADDFVATALRTSLRLRDAIQAAEQHGEPSERGSRFRIRDSATDKLLPDVEAATELARELGDEAYARLARVQLLFGAESEAALAAEWTTIWIQRAIRTVEGGSVEARRHHELPHMHEAPTCGSVGSLWTKSTAHGGDPGYVPKLAPAARPRTSATSAAASRPSLA